jgi:hypothetical protein
MWWYKFIKDKKITIIIEEDFFFYINFIFKSWCGSPRRIPHVKKVHCVTAIWTSVSQLTVDLTSETKIKTQN